MTRINTPSEMLAAAAAALMERDAVALERLRDINDGWMQTGEERRAMANALNAMIEAAYLLEGEPSEVDLEEQHADD